MTVGIDDDGVTIHTAVESPLWSSLLAGVQSPGAVTKHTISNIVEDNNPRRVRDMKETALYWVGKDGSPLTIKFPLLLDTEGYHGAIGPYFNLEKVRWSLILPSLCLLGIFFSCSKVLASTNVASRVPRPFLSFDPSRKTRNCIPKSHPIVIAPLSNSCRFSQQNSKRSGTKVCCSLVAFHLIVN